MPSASTVFVDTNVLAYAASEDSTRTRIIETGGGQHFISHIKCCKSFMRPPFIRASLR